MIQGFGKKSQLEKISKEQVAMSEKSSHEALEQRIQELEQAEEELRDNEKKYRSLFSNIPGMVYRGQSDWSTIIISNSEMVCGYSADAFKTKTVNWTELIHPDDKKRVIEEQFSQRREKKSIVQEYRIVTKDGSIRWVSDHKTWFYKEDGSFFGVDGIVYDISYRKEAEEELRETRDFLEGLITFANAPIIVWNSEAKITRFNNAFERLTGYEAREVVGKDFGILFPKNKQGASPF